MSARDHRRDEARYQKHSFARVKAYVRGRGLEVIDKRSAGWKSVEQFRDALLVDLGGGENVSTQQAALVDLASRCWLYLNHIDGFLLTQDRLVVWRGRKTTLLPGLQRRQGIASHFESLMARARYRAEGEASTKTLPSLRKFCYGRIKDTRLKPVRGIS